MTSIAICWKRSRSQTNRILLQILVVFIFQIECRESCKCHSSHFLTFFSVKAIWSGLIFSRLWHGPLESRIHASWVVWPRNPSSVILFECWVRHRQWWKVVAKARGKVCPDSCAPKNNEWDRKLSFEFCNQKKIVSEEQFGRNETYPFKSRNSWHQSKTHMTLSCCFILSLDFPNTTEHNWSEGAGPLLNPEHNMPFYGLLLDSRKGVCLWMINDVQGLGSWGMKIAVSIVFLSLSTSTNMSVVITGLSYVPEHNAILQVLKGDRTKNWLKQERVVKSWICYLKSFKSSNFSWPLFSGQVLKSARQSTEALCHKLLHDSQILNSSVAQNSFFRAKELLFEAAALPKLGLFPSLFWRVGREWRAPFQPSRQEPFN